MQTFETIHNDTITLNYSLSQSIPLITYKNLDSWEKEKISFFATIGKESKWDIYTISYVESLQDSTEQLWLHTAEPGVVFIYSDILAGEMCIVIMSYS